MKAMILAAGYGKRLAPITDTLPKPLIKVGNMSLIDRNINYLVKSGFHEIIINVSHHADQIINHINKNFSELNISFSIEDRPLGTGGGVYNALEKIGNNPFLLTNADILHQIDLKRLPKEVEAAHLVGINNPDHNPKGDFNVKDNIVEVHEHKNHAGGTNVRQRHFSDASEPVQGRTTGRRWSGNVVIQVQENQLEVGPDCRKGQ